MERIINFTGELNDELGNYVVNELLDIYDKMYNKALDGDVRCADWVNNFYKSDFFGDDEDDLQRLLKGVEINEN